MYPSTQQLFTENFKTFVLVDSLKEQESWTGHYQKGNLAGASWAIRQALRDDADATLTPAQHFYLAQCYLSESRPQAGKALFHLYDAAQQDVVFGYFTDWFKAMAYLKAGDKYNAGLSLERIRKYHTYGQKDAERILSERIF